MAMTPKEIIAVVQHFDAGGEVECRELLFTKHASKWVPSPMPIWNFDKYDYRPKPKPLERWLNLCANAQDDQAYETKEIARMAACKSCRTVHMREVVDDD